jgi:CheY-like chemotaxis protein
LTALRILHIDDEPDIREVVATSLTLDPELAVRGCASGESGLAAAADDKPDLILLDVMMPVMDGPATLVHLRENPRTSDIPVIFMTARAQTREIEQFKSLGAVGVIAKPFNPMTLATLVRSLVHSAEDALAASRSMFLLRVAGDTETLFRCWSALAKDTATRSALIRIRDVAHGLAGASGIFGFPHIGVAAANLEETAAIELNGAGEPGKVERALELLLTNIGSIVFDQIERTRNRLDA